MGLLYYQNYLANVVSLGYFSVWPEKPSPLTPFFFYSFLTLFFIFSNCCRQVVAVDAVCRSVSRLNGRDQSTLETQNTAIKARAQKLKWNVIHTDVILYPLIIKRVTLTQTPYYLLSLVFLLFRCRERAFYQHCYKLIPLLRKNGAISSTNGKMINDHIANRIMHIGKYLLLRILLRGLILRWRYKYKIKFINEKNKVYHFVFIAISRHVIHNVKRGLVN